MQIKKTSQTLTAILLLLWMLPGCTPTESTAEAEKPFALVIHGGAGTITRENIKPEDEVAYRQKLQEALDSGYAVLANGGSSLDAVQAAIMVLENSPLFNAGKGAVLTSEGRAELDASIMEGKELKAGAVAGVTIVKNPILAARAVMEQTPHVMLATGGADTFAAGAGLEIVPREYFITDERYQQWQRRQEKIRGNGFLPADKADRKFGTVGCVALDKQGNIAAGTSTGGMMMKRFGRVGDSPIIGAGTYADNRTCGISSTGHGEYFIRLAIAHAISAQMQYGKKSLQAAAEDVIHNQLQNLGGTGGVIGLDAEGTIMMEFNTAGMYRGWKKSNGEGEVKIYE